MTGQIKTSTPQNYKFSNLPPLNDQKPKITVLNQICGQICLCVCVLDIKILAVFFFYIIFFTFFESLILFWKGKNSITIPSLLLLKCCSMTVINILDLLVENFSLNCASRSMSMMFQWWLVYIGRAKLASFNQRFSDLGRVHFAILDIVHC